MAGDTRLESGNIAVLSDNVSITPIKFESYKTITENNRVFVIGCNKVEEYQIHEVIGLKESKRVYYTTREILDCLLNLAYKILQSEDEKKKIRLVIKWCEKYGMPMQKTKGVDVGYSLNTDCIYFDVGCFVSELTMLYSLFSYAGDLFGTNIGSNFNEVRIERWYLDKDNNRKKFTDDHKKAELCFDAQSTCSYYLEFVNGEPKMQAYFEDYIEMAKYQLLLLIASPDGYGIKRCKCCGSLFACERANRLYCNYCNPKKFYAKRKREEKKEVSDNG